MTRQKIAIRVVSLAVSTAFVAVSAITVPSTAAASDLFETAVEGVPNTVFSQPFAGLPAYELFAPGEARGPIQVNEELGQIRADWIASRLGFAKDKAMSKEQYRQFVTGRGVDGISPASIKAAELVDYSVAALTNTRANPYARIVNGQPSQIVLGSYGLIVSPNGMLSSPAIDSSPVRQVNWVLAPDVICKFPEIPVPDGIPCGYMGEWMRKNGARDTLAALYASAYTPLVPFGFASQGTSEPLELLENTRPDGSQATLGMAMAPSIWIVNFLLIYALNPELAAKMPAYWQAIPAEVAQALYASENGDTPGQIPYSQYRQFFE